MRHLSQNRILSAVLSSVQQLCSNRVISLVLAFAMLCSSVPFPVLSIEGDHQGNGIVGTPNRGDLLYDYDTMKITRNGTQIRTLDLYSHEKIELSADGIAEDADYQWQVQHPERDGVWVNIYDGTKQTISVTLALMENVLREDGTAKLRCRAYTDTYAYVSNTVTVKLLAEENVVAPAMYALPRGNDGIVTMADNATPEFVTVTIEYIHFAYVQQADGSFKLEEMGPAFTSYVATLQYNTSLLDTKVHCPTIVGYEPELKKVTVGGVTSDPASGEFDSDENEVIINRSNITADVVYRVEYHPADVEYEVRYFFQNIYDDLYVENTSIVTGAGISKYPVVAEGKTGLHPNTEHTEKEFSGFTSLYYEPETIAADGSTVFHVYYERNYYLMEFDCNEGYGTDTIYVRYGTHISVPNPVRSGWVFDGWDLVETGQPNPPDLGVDEDGDGRKDGDGNADPLPPNMPHYNSAYKALWKEANTTFTMAYWIVNDDGTRSFLGSHIEEALSNDKVSGSGNLGTTAGSGAICGELEHIHTASCYNCGLDEHTHHAHTMDCYSYLTQDGTVGSGSNDENVIIAANNGEEPKDGYIYAIYVGTEAARWIKLYFGGTYYNVKVNGSNSTTVDGLNAIVDGDMLYKGTYTASDGRVYYAEKYKAKMDCGIDACVDDCSITVHTHDSVCTTCKFDEHTHVAACYQDTRHMEYVDSVTIELEDGKEVTFATDKNVTVEGDGSTVINVYYRYKEYTLKFYYAASTGSGDDIEYSVVGGSTYYFGGQHASSSSYDDFNNSTTMDMLDRMFDLTGQIGQTKDGTEPTLNDKGKQRVTNKVYSQGSDYDSVSGRTYYYVSFKARYGDDISDRWPCDILAPVTMSDGDTNVNWTEDYAVASAWNGEHHVWYSKNVGNETIKGVYEKLDYKLLYDSAFPDSTTVSYLCFWENGATGIGWNIPELYRYNIYLETYSGQDTTGLQIIERNGKKYYLADAYNTCDNSTIAEQDHPSIAGYKPNGETWATYFIANTTKNESGAYYIGDERKYENGYVYSNGWNYEVALSEYALADEKYLIYDSTKYDPENPDTVINHGIYREAYDVNFFYDSLDYKLTFWNHDGYLTDGTGSKVAYDEPLRKYFDGITVNGTTYKGANQLVVQPDKYPDSLEPNAYEFKGWYTTAECLPGTEVNWATMTMPDEDFIAYAKWEPKIRNIYFYYTYDDMIAHEKDPDGDHTWHTTKHDGTPVTYPISVKHGEILGTTYAFRPVRWEDDNNNGLIDEGEEVYTFVGWFYIDDDGKKRFAPDTMEVKKDLRLFAEWRSEIDTQYEVTYVLKEAYDGYEAGTAIATPAIGHLTAGKTKTFTAKVGAELLPAFQDAPLFPTTNSHSILMEQEQEHNTHVFQYVHDEEVWYKVRYVNKITGVDLLDEKVDSSTKAIVTEKFVPITGYIPEDYYIRKVLASDGTAGSKDNVNPLNEIIFYYTPDTEHALYTIEYYTQVLGGSGDVDDANSWYLAESALGSDDLNAIIKAPNEPDKFDGFTLAYYTVTTYEKKTEEVDGVETITYTPKLETVTYDAANIPSGTLNEGGLEIRVYYTRNTYDYTIRYVDYVTGADLFFRTVGSDELFSKKPDNSAEFGSVIAHTALESFDKGNVRYNYYLKKPEKCSHGGTCDDPTTCLNNEWEAMRTQSMTVRSENGQNVLTFYYQAKTVTVFYKAVCLTKGATGYGSVSFSHESAAANGVLSGSTATAATGFEFKGWYSDAACTTKVSDEALYKPTIQSSDVDSVTYYALFEPILSSVTITKQVTGLPDGMSNDDVFLFHIQGIGKTAYIDVIVSIQGDGQVKLADLPVGDYIVTELIDWSWEYGNNPQWNYTGDEMDEATESNVATITVDKTAGTIAFTNAYADPDWLGGEGRNENIFEGNYTP